MDEGFRESVSLLDLPDALSRDLALFLVCTYQRDIRASHCHIFRTIRPQRGTVSLPFPELEHLQS